MTSRATIGAFAVAQVPIAVNQGFIVVNANDPAHQWWFFHEMRSRVAEFISHANGATFLELSRGKFKKFPIRKPTHEQAQAFSQVAGPLHDVAAQSMEEATSLAATRDELLPLLMSGSVRVKDAARAVEEVV
jgi:type I restriction enzyme S subunit